MSACPGRLTLGPPDTFNTRGSARSAIRPGFCLLSAHLCSSYVLLGAGFAFSVASVGVPLASHVGRAGYPKHKRFPVQDNAPGIISFVCAILQVVRASGAGFVFSGSTTGTPPRAMFPGFHLLSAYPIVQRVRTPGVCFAFSVASVGVPLASDVADVGYQEHKRYPSQGNPSRFLSFVCPMLEVVRTPGVGVAFSFASVGVPWVCDVGGVG